MYYSFKLVLYEMKQNETSQAIQWEKIHVQCGAHRIRIVAIAWSCCLSTRKSNQMTEHMVERVREKEREKKRKTDILM